jgi:hypothetical protein
MTTELDIRIGEVKAKINEIKANTTDENLQEMSEAQHALETELNGLLEQKEIISRLKY